MGRVDGFDNCEYGDCIRQFFRLTAANSRGFPAFQGADTGRGWRGFLLRLAYIIKQRPQKYMG